MGPKKVDKPKSNSEFVYDDLNWRRDIETANLNEAEWQVEVVMINSSGAEHDQIYLEQFETYAQTEKRFVIKNICKTETMFMINQLGIEKKVKDRSLRIFEEGYYYVKEKLEIPSDVLALTIKHLIIKMKHEYLDIQQQRSVVIKGLRQESETMLKGAEVKGPLAVPSGKRKKEPTDKLESTSEAKKYNTQLRMRGEEWRDKIYVDDCPTDGPNLYVILTGFSVPLLADSLLLYRVPLVAVVQIRIEVNKSRVPSGLINTGAKRGQSRLLLFENCSKYWQIVAKLRADITYSNNLKNCAFILFSPPYWSNDDLSPIPEKIYDELSFLVYDIHDLTRQHLHYLDNLEICNIPVLSNNINEYETLFDNCLEGIPLECITIYSIVDSMLHIVQTMTQLIKRQNLENTAIIDDVSTDKGVKAERIVSYIYKKFRTIEKKKKSYRLKNNAGFENGEEPMILKYGDIARYSTYHCKKMNLDEIVLSCLLNMPICNLWSNKPLPSEEREANINFHINVLLSCFKRDDIETVELNRLLHILACRQLYNNRSSLKTDLSKCTSSKTFKKKYLKRSVLAEPLSNVYSSNPFRSSIVLDQYLSPAQSEPMLSESLTVDDENSSNKSRIKLLFDCPDLSELLSAEEIAIGHPISHMIEDYEYFEDFPDVCTFQILLDCFNKYNCVEEKYCEVTDCIIIMFYNSHDTDGLSCNEWRSHFATPLTLTDFFDFVFEEQYDWIQNEERIYDEKRLIDTSLVKHDEAQEESKTDCIDKDMTATEMLLEGSIKNNKFLQSLEIENTIENEKNHESIGKTLQKSESKKPAKSVGQSQRERHMTKKYISKDLKKPFLGYDVSDRRVEVFGKDAMYFSKAGTKLSTLYTLLIPLNFEYVSLNVLSSDGCNSFWIHKVIGVVSPEKLESCESFTITSKDNVLINVKKVWYAELPINPPPEIEEVVIPNEKITNLKSTGKATNIPIPEPIEPEPPILKPFYCLYITWPNGHITESIHEKNSAAISHIKQYNLDKSKHPEISFRCVGMNGEVIIFYSSGFIEVLKPDGSIINIPRCEKFIKPTNENDTSFEAKHGKNKAKDKRKKKAASIIPIPVKPPEIILEFREYETIRNNGLKQNWVQDISVAKEKIIIKSATDYCSGEMFIRRMDGTNILFNCKGVQVTSFPGKTRIITECFIDDEEIFLDLSEEEEDEVNRSDGSVHASETTLSSDSKMMGEEKAGKEQRTDGYVFVHIIYTVEHPDFTRVSINKKTNNVTIESPNNSSITVDSKNGFYMKLDNATSANFNGENLHIDCVSCDECKLITTCDILIRKIEDLQQTTTSESDITIDKTWLTMYDHIENKKVVVHDDGEILLENINIDMPREISASTLYNNEINATNLDETFKCSTEKCNYIFNRKDDIRFFVLRRDYTCSEIVARDLVDMYKSECSVDPWSSVNEFDTFGDSRLLRSILKPIHLNETEKWLMDSKMAPKPIYLTYKDLKVEPRKGFYHWMRPYERFTPKPIIIENVLPQRCPSAFILRTLEQQWDDKTKEHRKGANELLLALFKYRDLMESGTELLQHESVIDRRTDGEKELDDAMQLLGERIYEAMKKRLAEDARSRGNTAGITTEPAPLDGESFVAEKPITSVKSVLLDEIVKIQKMSPNLERYWRRRAEELKNEAFLLYLLRDGTVPPYFHNMLGGAIWSEVNQLLIKSMDLAEKKIMTCPCTAALENETGEEEHDLSDLSYRN